DRRAQRSRRGRTQAGTTQATPSPRGGSNGLQPSHPRRRPGLAGGPAPRCRPSRRVRCPTIGSVPRACRHPRSRWLTAYRACPLDLAHEMASQPFAERFDVPLVLDVPRCEQRLAEDDRQTWPPWPSPGQPGRGPPAVGPPDPDGDHRGAARKSDARHASSDTHQRVRIGVHRSLGGHGEQDALPHSGEGGLQGRSVTFAAPDRDLIVATEDPAEEPLAEELGCDQEPTLTFDPVADLDRQDGPVERTDVVEGDDRRTARRQMLEALDTRSEREPDEGRDDREAYTPPA